MAILRQNEPSKRPSFEAQMVINSFLTDLASKVEIAKFKEIQSSMVDKLTEDERYIVQIVIRAKGSGMNGEISEHNAILVAATFIGISVDEVLPVMDKWRASKKRQRYDPTN